MTGKIVGHMRGKKEGRTLAKLEEKGGERGGQERREREVTR